jgi:hypothetical protein
MPEKLRFNEGLSGRHHSRSCDIKQRKRMKKQKNEKTKKNKHKEKENFLTPKQNNRF